MSKQIGDITLYTVLELSKLLDVTEVTLRRYIKEGKLKATKIAGKYHISQENVEALLKDGETRPSKGADTMDIDQVKQAKTAGEAQGYAIEWQDWQSEQALSYGELAEWQAVFTDLADKYDLADEFKENGII